MMILKVGEDAILLNTTPLAGGHGRNAMAHLGANGSVATGVLIEGHDGVHRDGTPEADDDGWYPVLEGATGGNGPVVEIHDLPQWIRAGDAATADITLEGVQ